MAPSHADWLLPDGPPSLADDEVHAWRIALDLPEALLADLAALLSPAERERAERFYFPRHRRRYIVSHGLLRAILALYVGCDPAELVFCHGMYGKPALPPTLGTDVRFNLSHSGEGALVGVARGREIGIDVEEVRPMADLEQLAARFFAPREAAALTAIAEALRAEAFFHCWTRKEAYIKACGEGMSRPLDQFVVSLLPGEPARLLEVTDNPAETALWSLRELAPWPGYVGCVAVTGQSPRISCFDAAALLGQVCAGAETQALIAPGDTTSIPGGSRST